MSAGDVSEGLFSKVYHHNLMAIWDSLLPVADIRAITKGGEIVSKNLRISEIAGHYLYNLIRFPVAVALLPFTFSLNFVSSLVGREIVSLSDQIDYPERFEHPDQVEAPHSPKAFGFSSSRFQDSAEGTFLDLSELQGIGTGDWDKIFNRDIQRVSSEGEKIGPITHGITLREGEKLEDLFVNIIDHSREFATLLDYLGCTAYRTSLERSVFETESGEFKELTIKKYHAFFAALKERGIEPWITLHHFTNPHWFENQGGFAEEKNIEGFVRYAEKMVETFPEVTHWFTFNEPGVRGLEGYVRGEHPPEQKSIAMAAQVMRNLLETHHRAFNAMKDKNPDLFIGISHQWLRFLACGGNPIEKITAYFFTSLIHTPILDFFREGKLRIQIPFRANVQLVYEDETAGKMTKFADFLGVQAYGYPRIKIGFNRGVPYPGSADKVQNFTLPFLGIGFTTGSTTEGDDRIQYFGPPARSSDLIHVLDEAFTIPQERIPYIGISETGRDAVGMRRGDAAISSNDAFQAQGVNEILNISQKYPLTFFFWWTLKRHCEWRSGSMIQLGLTDLRYDEAKGKYTFGKEDKEPAGIEAIRVRFQQMRNSKYEEEAS